MSISNEARLRLTDIADRIAEHEEVSLEEMTYITKWAKHNRIAERILNQARRRANLGKTEPGSLDEFLNIMDLGDPDPSNHVTGFDNPDEIVNWFKRDLGDDWRRRD